MFVSSYQTPFVDKIIHTTYEAINPDGKQKVRSLFIDVQFRALITKPLGRGEVSYKQKKYSISHRDQEPFFVTADLIESLANIIFNAFQDLFPRHLERLCMWVDVYASSKYVLAPAEMVREYGSEGLWRKRASEKLGLAEEDIELKGEGFPLKCSWISPLPQNFMLLPAALIKRRKKS